MNMRKKMASKKTASIILWALIIVFLVGIVLISIPNQGAGGSGDANTPENNKVVAMVNGEKITAGQFDEAYRTLLEQPGTNADLQTAIRLRQQALNKQIDEMLTKQGLKQEGIRESNSVLRQMARDNALIQLQMIRESVKAQHEEQLTAAKTKEDKAKVKSEDAMFTEQLTTFMKSSSGRDIKTVTEKQFTSWFVNGFLMNRSTTGAYDQFVEFARVRLLGSAMLSKLPADKSPTNEDFVKKMRTKEAKASMIFIAAKERTPAGLDAAKVKAEKLHAELVKNPTAFAEKAKTESDHALSAGRGGDIDWVQAEMQYIPLMAEYLSFATEPGQISPVTLVVHQSYMDNMLGYLIVKVDKVRDRTDLPKGFKWDAEKDIEVLRTKDRYLEGLGQSNLSLLKVKADIKALSPEVSAYRAEENNKYDDRAKFLKQARTDTNFHIPEEVRAAITYSMINEVTEPAERINLLRQVLPYAGSGSNASSIHFELAQAYLKVGQKAEAMLQFDYAHLNGDSTDTQLREKLKAEYKTLGNAEKVKEMDTWLKEHPAAPPSSPFMMPPQ